MCTAGQRVSLTFTGPGPSFLYHKTFDVNQGNIVADPLSNVRAGFNSNLKQERMELEFQ